MKLIFKLLLKVLFGFALLIAGAILYFLYWRYMPVWLHVDTIEKVVSKNTSPMGRADCDSFKMTPAEFEKHFARTHHIFKIEVHDYGMGQCYYKTKIDGREYRVWMYGIAQIFDGKVAEYYAISELKDVYE